MKLKGLLKKIQQGVKEVFSETYHDKCEVQDCEHCPFPPCKKDNKGGIQK